MGFIYLPHRRIHHRVDSGLWVDWDEAAEDTIYVDQNQDGTEDTYVCFFENTTTGGNETGRGAGLTGSNLVLTQVGNIAGATGSPPTRVIDESNDKFTYTPTFGNTILLTQKYTWVFKLTGFNSVSGNRSILNVYPNTGTYPGQADIRRNTSNTIQFNVYQNSGTSPILNATTVNTLPASGDVWVAVWADGTTKIRAGFSTVKPTKWSDFATNSRVEGSTVCNRSMTGSNWYSSIGIGCLIDCEIYYCLFSNICLIDNAS